MRGCILHHPAASLMQMISNDGMIWNEMQWRREGFWWVELGWWVLVETGKTKFKNLKHAIQVNLCKFHSVNRFHSIIAAPLVQKPTGVFHQDNPWLPQFHQAQTSPECLGWGSYALWIEWDSFVFHEANVLARKPKGHDVSLLDYHTWTGHKAISRTWEHVQVSHNMLGPYSKVQLFSDCSINQSLALRRIDLWTNIVHT